LAKTDFCWSIFQNSPFLVSFIIFVTYSSTFIKFDYFWPKMLKKLLFYKFLKHPNWYQTGFSHKIPTEIEPSFQKWRPTRHYHDQVVSRPGNTSSLQSGQWHVLMTQCNRHMKLQHVEFIQLSICLLTISRQKAQTSFLRTACANNKHVTRNSQEDPQNIYHSIVSAAVNISVATSFSVSLLLLATTAAK